MESCDPSDIISKLDQAYKVVPEDFLSLEVWLKTSDPFKVLIATILTQNTSDKGAKRAYEKLENTIGVTPLKLSSASLESIKECLKEIGLYNSKSKTIKAISSFIQEKYRGNIEEILNLGVEEARKSLTSVPGIGKKTADVVLLTCKNYEVFPVDTHIFRISERLGIVGNYDKVSKFWLKVSNKKNMLSHLLLITHGRKTCKANKPLCNICVINGCCKYYARLHGSVGSTSS
ncbi:endonuclease III [Metallosphaera tengchongensis]|uniref:thymine-DNA glycosylase n=1 Tax=Metallosphaera tengchongensis TaxID=1532350 RepID=A0A6N0NV34_9CREN|nr:endonuclease III [Metallosphaera tengchongensis]QKQ99702.1 endonuclease III [Metallosphaera tengchongensis]